jgi:hypothetical protein
MRSNGLRKQRLATSQNGVSQLCPSQRNIANRAAPVSSDGTGPTGKQYLARSRLNCAPEAWAIVARQPRTDERIFPYNAKSVSAAFTRACKILGIKDLRFHDGRHEATSRQLR